VVELAGIGPGPFCGMVLSDLGAELIRVERPVPVNPAAALDARTVLTRGRPVVGVDLKHPEGTELVLRLVESADALIEGFRPGVAERLGLGPDDCMARNPRLVYGRITGYGQDGPMAHEAGHDIDYIALAGALEPLGRRGEPPMPPLNLVGDFGGGAMLLAVGVLAALIEAKRSGQGQVVDASMVEGAALLTTMFHELISAGAWTEERGTNFLDTAAHYYNVYEAADGKYVAVGAMEPQFYRALLDGLGLSAESLPDQGDKSHWPELKERLAEVFLTKSRDEWVAHFAGTDACVTPALSPTEAQKHPHNVHRGTFIDVGGVVQPGPAPRFSRTPGHVRHAAPPPGAYTGDALAAWGFTPEEIKELHACGALAEVAES